MVFRRRRYKDDSLIWHECFLRQITILAVLLIGLFGGVCAAAADESLEQRGIVEPETYLSPQFRNEVTWTDQWEVDAEGLESDNESLLDRLSLTHNNEGTFQIIFIEAAGESPDDYARRLIRYRGVVNSTADVVWSSSTVEESVILYTYDIGGRIVRSLIEIRLVNSDRTLQVSELLVYPEFSESVFDLAQDDIVVDGAEPFAFFDEFPEDRFEVNDPSAT